MFVDLSAKSRLNIDGLLEALVLTADAALDLRANPAQDAQGIVIEAHLDRGRGPVATVLVQRGTLSVGDSIVAGPAYGRVRAMLNENGDPVDEALPSRPVMVLGLTAVPADREVGDIRYYSVIYQAIDEIEAAVKGMLKPEYEEVQLGTAEIREVFRSSRIGNIAGCMVLTGTIRRNSKARLLRDGAVVADNLDIASLRREKDDATEVRE